MPAFTYRDGIETPVTPDDIEVENENPTLGYFDIIGASYRQNNKIASFLNEEDDLPSIKTAVDYDNTFPNAPKEDWVSRAIEDGVEPEHIKNFFYVRTVADYMKTSRQYQKEKADREKVGQAGFGVQLMAGLTAGLTDLDPLMFFPAVKYAKTANKALNIAKTAGTLAVAGGVGGYVDESLLRASQISRSDDDMMYSVIGGMAVGGALGVGVEAFRKIEGIDIQKLEYDIGKQIAYEQDGSPIRDIKAIGYDGDKSVGAMQSPTTSLEEEGLAGGAIAQKVAKIITGDRVISKGTIPEGALEKAVNIATMPVKILQKGLAGAMDNPVVEGLTSPFKKARTLTQELAEPSGLVIKKAEKGIPIAKGGTIESLNKLARGRVITANKAAENEFIQMRLGRQKQLFDMTKLDVKDTLLKQGNMSYRDFQREIGVALRNGDEHSIPEVAKASKAYRKDVFDPMVKEAVELGLLPEGVSVDTAMSYFTRIYDIQKIISNPREFQTKVADWLEKQESENLSVQEQILPLLEQRRSLTGELRKAETSAKNRDVTLQKLKIQTEEGAKYVKDIRKRFGAGQGLVKKAENLFNNVVDKIRQNEGLQDDVVGILNKGLQEKLPAIESKLARLFSSKKQAQTDKKTFNRMVGRIKRMPKEFKPSVQYPVLYFFKGKIDPEGGFAKELKTLDVTPKTFPGYFKKGGYGEVDNIPISEFPELADAKGIERSQDYFEPNDIFEAVQDELLGNPILSEKDLLRYNSFQELSALKKEIEELGIDVNDENAFDVYSREKSNKPINAENEDGIDASEIEDLADELDFYDRAVEILPSLKKDIDDAIEEIQKSDPLKKLQLDKELRELKKEFDVLEKKLGLNRADLKVKADSVDKQKVKFGIKETERKILDRSATRRASARLKILLKKLDDARAIKKKNTETEYNLARLEEQLIELSARWQSKTGKEFKEALAKNGNIKEKLEEVLSVIKNTNASVGRAELEAIANEIKGRIVSTPDGRLPYWKDLSISNDGKASSSSYSDNLPGMFKNRAFNIPDNDIADFLISDADMVASSYVRKTAPYINMARRFDGDVNLTSAFKELEDEHNNALVGLSGEDAKALNNQYQRAIRNLAVLRDRALGADLLAHDTTSTGARALQSVRSFNILTLLGGVTLSSISDLGRLALLNMPDFLNVTKSLIGAGKFRWTKFGEMQDLGVVSELVSNNYAMQMGDVVDGVQSRTALERGIRYAGDKFSIASGIAPWQECIKQVVAITTESTILRLSKKLIEGKANTKEIKSLALNGIDTEYAKRILVQFEKYGENHKGLNLLNANSWDDKEVKDAFLSALVAETDRIQITPGYDKSVLLNSSELLKTISQFKSFFMSATTKILLRGLQDADLKTASSFITMMGLGMMTYAIKTKQADKELSDNPAVWAAEGFDRAGMMGIFMEINNIAEKTTGYGLRPAVGGDIASRYATRSGADSLMGPTFGQLQNLTAIMKAFGTGEWSEGDVNAMVRMIPGQNLPYMQPATNELKETLSENLID